MHAIYFLTDKAQRRSYIGYSNDVRRRYRTHKRKLAHAAKYTKTFEGCCLWAYITGFPSKRTALSAEWHAKRRRKTVQPLPWAPHARLARFLHVLTMPKFSHYELTVHFINLKVPTHTIHGFPVLLVPVKDDSNDD